MSEKNITPSDGAISTFDVDSTTNAVSVQDRVEMAANFLIKIGAFLPKDKKYYTYIWCQSGKKNKTIAFDVKKEEFKIARKAIELNDEGYNIFFGVHLTDKPMSEHERPHEEDITAQVAIIADLDCKSSWHVDTDKKKYPTIEQAKKFLPFEPSILVDSGGGLHSYVLMAEPIHFTNDDERKQAVSRNIDYIEMIRQNAGEFSKAIDGVHDLPRILRLPGTYNLKHGRENAPLCKIIKDTRSYYPLKSLDILIKSRPITPAKKPLTNQKNSTQEIFDSDKLKNNYPSTDNKPSEQERALAMLKTFSPAGLTYDEWLHIGMALKNNGNSCADWSDWSSQDDRFKIGECESKWSGFDRTDLTIATIHDTAKEYGNYSEKDFLRDWYRDNPEFDRKNYSRHADDRANDKKFSADAQIDSLKIELQAVNKKLADFDAEKTAAIEKLQSAISFDKDSVFADDILNAAAFAKLYDKKTFSDFKAAIQNQIKSQGTEKFITEWSGEVRDRITDIKNRKSDLLAQQKSINAKIVSLNFIATHDDLKDFVIPEGYEISNAGIEKIVGDKSVVVSRVPAVIKAKSKTVDDKTYKMILAYLSENGAWQNVRATGEEIIFNARKLIDLRAYGLPVTSTNANLFVDYLDAFKAANEKILPMSLTVSRCGWHNFYGQDYFIDTRRQCMITDNEKNIEVVVDDSSTFAQSLKSVGSIEEWRKAYDIAKKSPTARLIVAASIAAPLLKILGERNFLLYIHATTRAGKTTALFLAASIIGSEKIIRSFDATKNGLAGAAADVNDYAFLIDEKQVADNRLKEQFDNLVYALANGIGRTKLNKDSTLKKLQDWRTVAVMTGETPLFSDNVTGGANTRCLSIAAPSVILDADSCRKIRAIIKTNYGHALPLVIDEFFKYGFDNLREKYQEIVTIFTKNFPNLLNEYCRYMAILTLADAFLNIALGTEKFKALEDATKNMARDIFSLVPTLEEISDTPREKDFVLGFIAQNQKYFLGATPAQIENLPFVYGKFDDDFVYITVSALKQACSNDFFDYSKVVADLINDGFFTPDSKVAHDRKKPNQSVLKKISGVNVRCYRIPKEKVVADDLR